VIRGRDHEYTAKMRTQAIGSGARWGDGIDPAEKRHA
jgi:hypothetical protein